MAAFILDLVSRMIIGWQVSDTLRIELALDALEIAAWSRGDQIDGPLVHHSAHRAGDFYVNAGAESPNSLYQR